jgi:hypothetical protein
VFVIKIQIQQQLAPGLGGRLGNRLCHGNCVQLRQS